MDAVDKRVDKRAGAVIVFAAGVPKQKADDLVFKLYQEGLIESVTVREYNRMWGDPVWYIP